MKTKPRISKRQAIAKRITAPETRRDEETGKNIVLLSYIDAGSYQRHVPTTKDLFLYAAGTDEEGEIPDGLDRLLHHGYRVHFNGKGKDAKAIGLDIVPSRLYRSGVVPRSQEGVDTLKIQFELDGAVARVVQRPFNIRMDHSLAVIDEITKVTNAGKAVTTSMRLGQLGRVVNVTENIVEVKLSSAAKQQRGVNGAPETDIDNIHEQEDEAPSVVPAGKE